MKKFYLKTLGVLCLSLFAFNMSAQITYYVKTDGTGAAVTATGWGTASKDLQEVINTAQSGDKIFVAMGTYLPNRPANTPTVINASSRDNAFVLKNGVSIYGGFAGTESNESQRVAGNITILSGDLSGNDVDETTINTANYMTLNKTDNVSHVVLALGISTVTVFDGFTITKGNASATSVATINVNGLDVDKRFGGGIYVLDVSANLTISNIVVTINRANGDGYGSSSGGGFYINNSSPTITNCEITKNFNTHGTAPKTSGTNYGSGMSLVMSSSPIITNTTFSDNFGLYGGALSANGGSPKFTNCVFKLNRGNGRGGAIDIRGASPIFTNCLFSENSAGSDGGGGAVYNYSGRPTFLNCIFYKNGANASGTTKPISAAYGGENGSNYGAIFINNTFYENQNTSTGTAANYNAGIQILAVNSGAAFSDKKTYLHNNIFFSNTALNNAITPDLFVSNLALLGGFNNNIIQQTEYVPTDQNNKMNIDPLFISTTLGHIGFLAPSNISLAKDAGNDVDNSTSVDFNGRARKNGAIDIGAVEYYAILPVSFISFTAKAITGGSQLSWKAASETNNKQYIISRSTDGKNFTELKRIQGVGTSVEAQSYSYVDQTTVGGTYYYKLEQQDLNGDINYLATRVVKIGLSANPVSAYPNPTQGVIVVDLPAGNYNKYSVIALHGTIVMNGNISNADKQISLDLSGLAAGTYVVRLIGTSDNKSARVIKL